jgi:2-haloacid dehalogenase
MRRAVLFDVVGTLFDVTPLQRRLRGSGFDAWFERLLHTATSLTLAGRFEPFADIAASTLKTTIARNGLSADAGEVLALLQELPADNEALAAVELLDSSGVLVGALTNSGEKQTQKLLDAAGLAGRIVDVVSVEEVELYKPHPAVYRHAAERLGVAARAITLIATHAWDVVGAKEAGLDAIWIDRVEREWPFPKGKPRRVAHGLLEAAELALAKR